jgi:acetyl esterase/lipase
MTLLARSPGRFVRALVGVLMVLFIGRAAHGEGRVEHNVIYGMYSGTALLMDVYVPSSSNGAGIVYVPGSAWQAPLGYGAPSFKDRPLATRGWVPALQGAGYTVFVVNHRQSPRFPYPAPLEDIQRAIRFVRHHAGRYGIDANRIGGMGHSSGAHLIGLAAMLASGPLANDGDAVNGEPATLQAVALQAGPSDLQRMTVGIGSIAILMAQPTAHPEAAKALAAASPVTYVSRSSPPVLLLHGDADDQVPIDQAVQMNQALQNAGATVSFVRVPGGTHSPDFSPAKTVAEVIARGFVPLQGPQVPDFMGESLRWFDRHLRGAATKPAR